MEIKLQQIIKRTNKHIYQRPIVAKHYDKSFVRSVPTQSFNNWVNSILTTYIPKSLIPLKIFEGGIGTGFFSIPTIEYLVNSEPKGYFYGIDNSEVMLNVLFSKKALNELQRKSSNRIALGNGDLEKKICFPDSFFDASILAGVLHCLHDFNTTLSQVYRVLKKNGYLIIVIKTDESTKILSGEGCFDSKINPSYIEFWKYYYKLRREKELKIDTRYRLVFDEELVRGKVTKVFSNKLEFCDTINFRWKSSASFLDIIKAIKYGLSFALGQGISINDHKLLSIQMLEWLNEHNLKSESIAIEHQMEALIWKKNV